MVTRWDLRFPQQWFSWTPWCSKMKASQPSKHRGPLTPWHNATSQKTWMLRINYMWFKHCVFPEVCWATIDSQQQNICFKCYGIYVKWQCAVIINGTSITEVLTMPENMFSVSIALFFCGHHLVVVFAVMKAVDTAVGGRLGKLVLWWPWAGHSRVQIPSGASDFTVLQNIQTSFWGSACLLFSVYQELFLLEVKQLEYEPDKSRP